jgi:hypothetical protein
MAVSDDEVIAELTADGTRVEDHFLIGPEICIVNRNGQLISMVIEEVEGEDGGAMYFAIVEVLRRHGARVYRSHEEYNQQTRS